MARHTGYLSAATFSSAERKLFTPKCVQYSAVSSIVD
jgi:hypothetical protein